MALHRMQGLSSNDPKRASRMDRQSRPFGDRAHGSRFIYAEIQELTISIGVEPESGNAMLNAREGAHDALLLAQALAVFGLSRTETVRQLMWFGRSADHKLVSEFDIPIQY